MRLFFSFSFFLFAFLIAHDASATNPSDATLAQALFTTGKDAMARGDLPTACTRFAESYKLDPAVGTLLNLATCEERSNKLVASLDHFTTARTQLPKDDFRIAFASERITSLTQRMPHIVIRFSSSTKPPGTRVLRDDAEIDPSTIDRPIAMDPGMHVIVVEAPSLPPQRTPVTLRDSEEKVIDVRFGAAAPPSPTAAQQPSPSPVVDKKADETKSSTRRTFAYVTAGVGVAGLATGAITGLMTITAASTYRAHCENGICDPDGLDAASTGRTTRIVSPIGFAVGVVFGIASAYLFLTSSPSSAKSKGLPKSFELVF